MSTRKVMLSVLLGLIIGASLSVVWVVKAEGVKQVYSEVPTTPYVIHRSEEQPVTLERTHSLVPSQAPTTMMPWATTFDYTTGLCTQTLCSGTHISGIQADSKGDIWFSDSLSQHIGYLVPATRQEVKLALPMNSHPHDGLNKSLVYGARRLPAGNEANQHV